MDYQVEFNSVWGTSRYKQRNQSIAVFSIHTYSCNWIATMCLHFSCLPPQIHRPWNVKTEILVVGSQHLAEHILPTTGPLLDNIKPVAKNSGPGHQTRTQSRSSLIFSRKERWVSLSRRVSQTVGQITNTGVSTRRDSTQSTVSELTMHLNES
ncbi:uncharacterized protein LOC120570223 isoform X2 [Perca fluviatilis]|uniref:uncharacterized protein LOC120570223 isoform X2 n=1 Tax=Perca fluviatilis TaxID=8168 RepID=UPI0019653A53|nr:uncharacterized protein LOC120570223 isoform X2 [Perca fluviatilis]